MTKNKKTPNRRNDDVWGDSSLESKESLSKDFCAKIIKKSQNRILCIDILFMIVIGFKEILSGLIFSKNPDSKK